MHTIKDPSSRQIPAVCVLLLRCPFCFSTFFQTETFHQIVGIFCDVILTSMSYEKVLRNLQTRPVEIFHLAIGMKKPGEQNGIWLFGERHTHNEETSAAYHGFEGAATFDEMLKDHTTDSVLLFEGSGPPGEAIFANAPGNIKEIVRVLTPVQAEKVTTKREEDISDLHENGYELLHPPDYLLESWMDPEFWEFAREVSDTMEYLGGKFASMGGIAVNIENKVRAYVLDAIDNFMSGELDTSSVDDLFTVSSWALGESIVDKTVAPIHNVKYKNSGFNRFQVYFFYQNVTRSLKDRFGEVDLDILRSRVLPEMRRLLKDNLFDDTTHFVNLFHYVMMDINISLRMKSHPNMDFISVCGAAHTVNQMVALSDQGYEVEYVYFNGNPEQDFILPSHRTNVSGVANGYGSKMIKLMEN